MGWGVWAKNAVCGQKANFRGQRKLHHMQIQLSQQVHRLKNTLLLAKFSTQPTSLLRFTSVYVFMGNKQAAAILAGLEVSTDSGTESMQIIEFSIKISFDQ